MLLTVYALHALPICGIDKAGLKARIGVTHHTVHGLGLTALNKLTNHAQLHAARLRSAVAAEREEDAIEDLVFDVGEGL